MVNDYGKAHEDGLQISEVKEMQLWARESWKISEKRSMIRTTEEKAQVAEKGVLGGNRGGKEVGCRLHLLTQMASDPGICGPTAALKLGPRQ